MTLPYSERTVKAPSVLISTFLNHERRVRKIFPGGHLMWFLKEIQIRKANSLTDSSIPRPLSTLNYLFDVNGVLSRYDIQLWIVETYSCIGLLFAVMTYIIASSWPPFKKTIVLRVCFFFLIIISFSPKAFYGQPFNWMISPGTRIL